MNQRVLETMTASNNSCNDSSRVFYHSLTGIVLSSPSSRLPRLVRCLSTDGWWTRGSLPERNHSALIRLSNHCRVSNQSIFSLPFCISAHQSNSDAIHAGAFPKLCTVAYQKTPIKPTETSVDVNYLQGKLIHQIFMRQMS